MLLEMMKKRNTDQAGYMLCPVKAVAQSALSRADIAEAIIDISLDDEVLQRASNSDTAKSNIKKAI